MKKTIFFVLGKSGAGKTTLVNNLMNYNHSFNLGLQRKKLHTNRPRRYNEGDSEYYFDKDSTIDNIKQTDVFDMQYYTVKTEQGKNAIWYYYTSMEEFNNEHMFYIVQGPLEMYDAYKRKFKDVMNIVLLFISCNEKERLIRNIIRESNKQNPNWKELLRRLHEDETRFENLDDIIIKDNAIEIFGDYKPNEVLSQIIIEIQKYKLNQYEKQHKEE